MVETVKIHNLPVPDYHYQFIHRVRTAMGSLVPVPVQGFHHIPVPGSYYEKRIRIQIRKGSGSVMIFKSDPDTNPDP